jgi:hypothetical protein
MKRDNLSRIIFFEGLKKAIINTRTVCALMVFAALLLRKLNTKILLDPMNY